jgi:predicted Zn-dependent protease with MMP-like domain
VLQGPPTARNSLIAAIAAMIVGIAVLTILAGFSGSSAVRVLQGLAVFGACAILVGGAVVLALVRLAGWRDPESEKEFEAIVQNVERLAADDSWEYPDEEGYDIEEDDDVFDLRNEEDFRALVRAAIDDLPLEFHRALEHVAVVISDGGARRRAYGLYQGDTVARDYFHDRIVIFRDTLLRDFGDDRDQLRAQVTRTLRHELAHHLGWDENGVRGLGL